MQEKIDSLRSGQALVGSELQWIHAQKPGVARRTDVLRAGTDLARLWLERGRREEARDLVSTVYGWFTEGFETPDLKDAKVLLDELSA